jgi:hypothetical protein
VPKKHDRLVATSEDPGHRNRAEFRGVRSTSRLVRYNPALSRAVLPIPGDEPRDRDRPPSVDHPDDSTGPASPAMRLAIPPSNRDRPTGPERFRRLFPRHEATQRSRDPDPRQQGRRATARPGPDASDRRRSIFETHGAAKRGGRQEPGSRGAEAWFVPARRTPV